MLSINPFVELSSFISAIAMQIFVLVMVALTVGGTILDMIHKKNAKYFFENSKKLKKSWCCYICWVLWCKKKSSSFTWYVWDDHFLGYVSNNDFLFSYFDDYVSCLSNFMACWSFNDMCRRILVLVFLESRC